MLVTIETENGVRTVTMNRPEKRNAMTDEMLTELTQAFTSQPDAQERVTVLRGAGPSFCAGRDISQGMLVPIEPVFHAVETYPLPVVAVVQGNAIAGGCEIALHCDFVVAAIDARFGMSLAQIGLAPTWFLAKKLLEVAGPVGAREILLLGDPLPAQRMFDLGMISRLASVEDLDEVTDSIVQRLVSNAPLSLKAMKALLLREMTFRDGIAHEDVDKLVSLASSSEDAVEGKKARLEKRSPDFKGR
ncbi:MAG: enoyl-CoA hydratase-related protein [Proteobacteria bacterium]|nr:enoyl-CoA hydratase-related protein [Pseudomonadota bacterium]